MEGRRVAQQTGPCSRRLGAMGGRDPQYGRSSYTAPPDPPWQIVVGIVLLLIWGAVTVPEVLNGGWGSLGRHLLGLAGLVGVWMGTEGVADRVTWLHGDRLHFHRYFVRPLVISLEDVVAVETKGKGGSVVFRYRKPGVKALRTIKLDAVPADWDEFKGRVARANPYVDLHNA